MNKSALLVLADGTVFYGKSIGAVGTSTGEVVFNTSMTGYQEILTDPSYSRQIVTLTYPHIGNVGINAEDVESRDLFCSGLIIRSLPKMDSNWRCEKSLTDYLIEHNMVGLSEIDTRKLTRLIRNQGVQAGCLIAGQDLDEASALLEAQAFPGLSGMDLAKEVSIDQAYDWSGSIWKLGKGYTEPSESRFKVVACDYGVKHNILRLLSENGCDVTVVPAQSSTEEILQHKPDGVFLSNGPGDPEPCDYAINAITDILDRDIPIFGICLGHQLLSLASGAKTQKMKFGHHGANHPVQDLESGQVLITSQNHGFTVDEESLPDNVKVTHRSLFDGTLQGMERTDKRAFSFQGHPEASPGPKDIQPLFRKFIRLMEEAQQESSNA